MKDKITGKAYVLGDDVDTDQIIPAEYLVYDPTVPEERKLFGKYALASVPPGQMGLPDGHVPFVKEDRFRSEYAVIIAGRNFGCGSSREHAPLALAEAGVEAVVAESYARIFFRNAVNGGYLVPLETPERLCEQISTGDEVEIDVAAGTLTDKTNGRSWRLQPLGDARAIIEAGGIFDYARQTGMLA